YTELAGFGTCPLYIEEDPARYLRGQVLTIGTYCLAADALGRVNTVYRRFPLTARQMVEEFGEEKVSGPVSEAAQSTPFEYFEVVHAVQPRGEGEEDKRDRRHKPFESVYFEYGEEGDFLREGGYEEFPFMAPRWDVSGADVYGRSPGMDCLADVKMLNDVCKSLVKGVHKGVDPPMLVPPGYKDRLSLLPGAINYGDGTHGEGVRPLYQVQLDLAAAQALKEDILSAVREGFFNDLFVFLLRRPGVTATEVVERHEEKLLLLGPVIERQQSELLDPLIERVFGILERSGRLPGAPPEIQGYDLKIDKLWTGVRRPVSYGRNIARRRW
ncbi:MAG: portal protein, partial [Thermodesulfobacteriota bacterium]